MFAPPQPAPAAFNNQASAGMNSEDPAYYNPIGKASPGPQALYGESRSPAKEQGSENGAEDLPYSQERPDEVKEAPQPEEISDEKNEDSKEEEPVGGNDEEAEERQSEAQEDAEEQEVQVEEVETDKEAPVAEEEMEAEAQDEE